MTDDVFDDIANLRIDPATAATARGAKGKAKPAKAKWQRHFIRVPCAWADRLESSTRISTYRIALRLIYATWRNGGRSIRLGNAALGRGGITPRAKRLALGELERMGLIRVQRQPRKSPLITVVTDPELGDA